MPKPPDKPIHPNFSSGPCDKFPGWDTDLLKSALTGRSHRDAKSVERLLLSGDITREILQIPEDYLIGIIPGSDTGAFETAMWNMIGPRGVDVLYSESFGKGWAGDLTKELEIANLRSITGEYGEQPSLADADFDRDVIFVANGTTGGVRVPDPSVVDKGGWDAIPNDRKGLTMVDATSAVYAQNIPWDKVDVATWSWQKSQGGEGAHGMMVLSPRAVERIESYTPEWPLPKIMRLRKPDGSLNAEIFKGKTINTPSMLAVEDNIQSLGWMRDNGGLEGMIARADANLAVFENWLGEDSSLYRFLAEDPDTRSNTSICLQLNQEALRGQDPAAVAKAVKSLLAEEGAAYDIGSYRDAPPGLRIWGGPTKNAEDIEALLPWLKWAVPAAVRKIEEAAS